jgi:hypothetical protein
VQEMDAPPPEDDVPVVVEQPPLEPVGAGEGNDADPRQHAHFD